MLIVSDPPLLPSPPSEKAAPVAKVKQSPTATAEVKMSRRKTGERRKSEAPVVVERRKTQRRRQIDPTTCERDYSNDEIEFMQALDDYKRRSGRMFPTCSEILEVIRALGYERIGVRSLADVATVNE